MKHLKQMTSVLLALAITGNSVMSPLAFGREMQLDEIYHAGKSAFDTGWLYENVDSWYYRGSDGRKLMGWYQDTDGSWYYFNKAEQGIEGQMKYGWYQDEDGSWYFLNTEHQGFFGAAVKGWAWIDGKCYYFGPDCRMYADGMTPDGYFVNSDGAWIVDAVVQTRTEPGFLSVHEHSMSEKAESRASGKSTGSSGNSGSSGSSGNSDNENTNNDTYRVYENANQMIFDTKDTVKTFANETEEDKQVLNELADSIVDIWTEASAVENEVESGGENQVGFQTVEEICLTVTENSVFVEQINENRLKENDVIYIPSCEAFPTGISLVYLSHDDTYEGEVLENYNQDEYEVIHLIEAAMSDMFTEEINYSAGGVNETRPVQYIWTPVLFGDTILNQMAFEPETSNLETLNEVASNSNASLMNAAFVASASDAEIYRSGEDTSEEVKDLQTSSNAVRTSAVQLKERTKESSSDNHFKLNQSNTEDGFNFTLEADKLVLYDADGNLNTNAFKDFSGYEKTRRKTGSLHFPSFFYNGSKTLRQMTGLERREGERFVMYTSRLTHGGMDTEEAYAGDWPSGE